MSILLEQVSKEYGDAPAVNDVTVNIADGELFVLLGPSGSGKSTLLRAIAGSPTIDHGRIVLHGRDVTQSRREGARGRLRVPELRAVPSHDRRATTSSSRCARGEFVAQSGGSGAPSC